MKKSRILSILFILAFMTGCQKETVNNINNEQKDNVAKQNESQINYDEDDDFDEDFVGGDHYVDEQGQEDTDTKENSSSNINNQEEDNEAKEIIYCFVDEVVEVNMNYVDLEDDSNEYYAIVEGKSGDGLVWTYQTSIEPRTELEGIELLAVIEDKVYLNDAGTIVCIDRGTGYVFWKNELGGAGCSFTFDDNENLYICGYYGPDLHVIDKDGNTVKHIESFDNEYYWPYELIYDNGILTISFGCEMDYSVTVDTADYSYKLNK